MNYFLFVILCYCVVVVGGFGGFVNYDDNGYY